jgi:hypothetical protein
MPKTAEEARIPFVVRHRLLEGRPEKASGNSHLVDPNEIRRALGEKGKSIRSDA